MDNFIYDENNKPNKYDEFYEYEIEKEEEEEEEEYQEYQEEEDEYQEYQEYQEEEDEYQGEEYEDDEEYDGLTKEEIEKIAEARTFFGSGGKINPKTGRKIIPGKKTYQELSCEYKNFK